MKLRFIYFSLLFGSIISVISAAPKQQSKLPKTSKPNVSAPIEVEVPVDTVKTNLNTAKSAIGASNEIEPIKGISEEPTKAISNSKKNIIALIVCLIIFTSIGFAVYYKEVEAKAKRAKEAEEAAEEARVAAAAKAAEEAKKAEEEAEEEAAAKAAEEAKKAAEEAAAKKAEEAKKAAEEAKRAEEAKKAAEEAAAKKAEEEAEARVAKELSILKTAPNVANKENAATSVLHWRVRLKKILNEMTFDTVNSHYDNLIKYFNVLNEADKSETEDIYKAIKNNIEKISSKMQGKFSTIHSRAQEPYGFEKITLALTRRERFVSEIKYIRRLDSLFDCLANVGNIKIITKIKENYKENSPHAYINNYYSFVFSLNKLLELLNNIQKEEIIQARKNVSLNEPIPESYKKITNSQKLKFRNLIQETQDKLQSLFFQKYLNSNSSQEYLCKLNKDELIALIECLPNIYKGLESIYDEQNKVEGKDTGIKGMIDMLLSKEDRTIESLIDQIIEKTNEETDEKIPMTT